MAITATFKEYWDPLRFGLRDGTEAKNAAYSMNDLDEAGYDDVQIMYWYTGHPQKEPALGQIWTARLRNTICYIAGFYKDTSKKMSLLIVSKAGTLYQGTGQRYTVPNYYECRTGDGKTFKKVVLTEDSQILHKHEIPATPEGVEQAFNWVCERVKLQP